MSDATLELNAACPRCGGPFHCGAADARCDCFDLKLDEALRSELARQYQGCLCLSCLRELKRQQAEAGKT
ncbi:cysteine-rich CWC family protein [Pelomonas sp. SE-A7]|uniref:cysteine-rich CWC family protein n=1 Tax=Pelomonas sp. SE-A7 TaxID=3054953 RepID=UPI00259CD573|nr:cysteine-rich CWC family protein [Pelomonas sp. SE-A7]MDM4766584.1 cysteine-rich CWC family protein [Pelomonas sp. SE-A7]